MKRTIDLTNFNPFMETLEKLADNYRYRRYDYLKTVRDTYRYASTIFCKFRFLL